MKNYKIKPQKQNSGEFKYYIRNLELMVSKMAHELNTITEEMKFASREMREMPEGRADLERMEEKFRKNSEQAEVLMNNLEIQKGILNNWLKH